MQRQPCAWATSGLVAALVVCLHGGALQAQATAGSVATEAALNLPDSPGALDPYRAIAQAAAQTPVPAGAGKMLGTVLDITGDPIPGALVTLVMLPANTEQTATSDADGNFGFANLPAGTFQVSVTAKGFETIITSEIKLRAGDIHEVQLVRMPVAVAETSVEVVVTEEELAREQVKEQEHQRVLGIVPNFYTSFLWNAAPLPAKQKYNLALHSSLDPIAFLQTAGTAAIEFNRNRYPGYGNDAAAYGEYYGAALADHFSARLLRSAVLPALFHQDPRYFWKGHGTVAERLRYALTEGFLCRGDNGHRQFNYSFIAGDFLAAGLSNAYRPNEDRSASLTIENAFIILGGHIAQDVVREFLLNRATTNMPKTGSGQPKR